MDFVVVSVIASLDPLQMNLAIDISCSGIWRLMNRNTICQQLILCLKEHHASKDEMQTRHIGRLVTNVIHGVGSRCRGIWKLILCVQTKEVAMQSPIFPFASSSSWSPVPLPPLPSAALSPLPSDMLYGTWKDSSALLGMLWEVRRDRT